MSTLELRLHDLVAAIKTDIKATNSAVNFNTGTVAENLTSIFGVGTTFTSLMSGLLELKNRIDAVPALTSVISDSTASGTTTYSSNKINTAISTAISDLVNGAPTALNTLNELATQLSTEGDALAALLITVDNNKTTTDAFAVATNASLSTLTTNVATVTTGLATVNTNLGDVLVDLAALYASL